MEIFKETEKYTIIYNFLSSDEYRKIRMFAESIDDDLYTDSKTFWPDVLWNEGATVENGVRVFPYNEDGIGNWHYNLHNEECILLFQDRLVSYFNKQIGIDIVNRYKIFETKINKGPNGSSLFWHTDNQATYGVSYYLNERWHNNWGGQLLLAEGSWVNPAPNSLVIINAPYLHRTAKIENGADERLSLQTFIKLGDI